MEQKSQSNLRYSVCCIPAESLTFDLVVAFHRGLSCSSTTASLALILLLCHTQTMCMELVQTGHQTLLRLILETSRHQNIVLKKEKNVLFWVQIQLSQNVVSHFAKELSRSRIEVALYTYSRLAADISAEEMKDKQKRKKERTWAEAARMVNTRFSAFSYLNVKYV